MKANIPETFETAEFQIYMELCFEKLEWLEYPELVVDFDAEQVGNSMAGSIRYCFIHGLSPMMCSVIIWSLTMSEQVLPYAARSIKH